MLNNGLKRIARQGHPTAKRVAEGKFGKEIQIKLPLSNIRISLLGTFQIIDSSCENIHKRSENRVFLYGIGLLIRRVNGGETCPENHEMRTERPANTAGDMAGREESGLEVKLDVFAAEGVCQFLKCIEDTRLRFRPNMILLRCIRENSLRFLLRLGNDIVVAPELARVRVLDVQVDRRRVDGHGRQMDSQQRRPVRLFCFRDVFFRNCREVDSRFDAAFSNDERLIMSRPVVERVCARDVCDHAFRLGLRVDMKHFLHAFRDRVELPDALCRENDRSGVGLLTAARSEMPPEKAEYQQCE